MANFSIPDDGTLDFLQTKTHRAGKAEVVRDALAVYKLLVERAAKGHRIYVGPSRLTTTEVKVTSLEPLQKAAWEIAEDLLKVRRGS